MEIIKIGGWIVLFLLGILLIGIGGGALMDPFYRTKLRLSEADSAETLGVGLMICIGLLLLIPNMF